MNSLQAFIDPDLEGFARVVAGSISAPHSPINSISPRFTGCAPFEAGNVERVVTSLSFFNISAPTKTLTKTHLRFMLATNQKSFCVLAPCGRMQKVSQSNQ